LYPTVTPIILIVPGIADERVVRREVNRVADIAAPLGGECP
jgi:hypothetical protein